MSKGMLGLLSLSDSWGPISTLIERLVGEQGEEWLYALNKFLRKENPWVFNPHRFFRTRPGLHVWPKFKKLVRLASSSPSVNSAELGKVYDLTEDMSEDEIRKELGVNHVFENIETFLKMLAGKLEIQWKGEGGDLLTTNYTNIFFVLAEGEVFVVGVSWGGDNHGWHLDARRPTNGEWPAHHRAFSATA